MKIFDLDFRKGTLIDSFSKTKGAITDGEFKKTEKGLAMKFNGSSTKINYGNETQYQITGAITLEVWFKTSSQTQQGLIYKDDGVNRCYKIQLSNNQYGEIVIFKGSSPIITSGNTNLADGKWHHLVGVFVPSTSITLYADGLQVAKNTTNIPATIDNDPADLEIGRKGDGVFYMDGFIGGCRIYNESLSQTQQTELYKQFLNSYGTEKQKRNFTYPKPTDLSNEVESKLKQVSQNSEFDTDSWWISTQSSTIYISDGILKYRGCGNGQGFRMPPDTVDIGDKMVIAFKMSNLISGKLRFYNGSEYISSYYDSNGEYVFEMTAKSTYGFYLMGAYNTNCDIEYCRVFVKKGLVAAYNMIPNNGKLIDISGNGNNGNINGALSVKDGMRFKSENTYVTISSITCSDASYAFRIKSHSFKNFNNILRGNTSYSRIATDINGKLYYESDSNYDGVFSNNGLELDKWYNIVIVRSYNDIYFYINGNLDAVKTLPTGDNLTITNIGGVTFGDYLDAEIQDVKIYNYSFHPQQAVAYHNSFRKPTLIEDFSDEGADGVVKTPKGWIKGTGSYKIGEVVNSGNQVPAASSNFETDGTSWWNVAASDSVWNENTKDWTVTGTGGYNTISTASTPAGYYKISFKAKSSNLTTPIHGVYSSAGYIKTISNPSLTTEYQDYSFEGYMAASKIIFITSNGALFDGKNITFDNIKFDLMTPAIGTKYLECTSSGTTVIQSKQAYGEWEFDVNRNDALLLYPINNNTSKYPDAVGYQIAFELSNQIIFRRATGSGVAQLFVTANNYIDKHTDYSVKLARLKSAGVFKDIPTLQTGLQNATGSNEYDSFEVEGINGFSAIAEGSATQICATTDLGVVKVGEKYLVEFDLTLNSGVLPNLRFSQTLTSGTASNQVDAVEGSNSIIFTINAERATSVLGFWLFSELSDYEIKGLTIKKVYEPNTFALFIKGGSFGDDYTLVDTTGGSGHNPVVDSTYNSSEFMVLDLDTGDKISNIKTTNEVEQ